MYPALGDRVSAIISAPAPVLIAMSGQVMGTWCSCSNSLRRRISRVSIIDATRDRDSPMLPNTDRSMPIPVSRPADIRAPQHAADQPGHAAAREHVDRQAHNEQPEQASHHRKSPLPVRRAILTRWLRGRGRGLAVGRLRGLSLGFCHARIVRPARGDGSDTVALMLADEETQSDMLLHSAMQEIRTMFAHIQEDMHALADQQARVDKLLTEFDPITGLYASRISAYTPARHARKQRKGAPANG